ncbi:MAG: group 1 glycosyl transferase [Paenibacillus sp. RIFOXYA1_FULL_44_5]|nr:MAG: group 1 glycosyl transferase [Paenibacillus sp. RIFOXYA1_FULL_44_5]
MRILSTGMEWVGRNPGGLNQYFADYIAAMTGIGHIVNGFIMADGEEINKPSNIHDVMAYLGKGGTTGRMQAFRRSVKMSLLGMRPEVFNPHFALYAMLIDRRMLPPSVPIVTHFHGPWADESLIEGHGSTSDTIRVWMKKRIETTTYQRSDAFIVLSEYFRDILTREYGIDQEFVHVIPGAVDTSRFVPAFNRDDVRQSLGIAPDDTLLFTARRLVRRMGIDRFISAFRIVQEHHPKARLCIAGDGYLREELAQQIKSLGLEHAVKLLGRVSADDFVKWYQAADLTVVPTIQLEGFGLVTVESLACGTPVIGTPVGGTKEILQPFDERMLFPDATSDGMAHHVNRILSGMLELPSREQCRNYAVHHYTWGRVSAKVTDVFEETVRRRKEAERYAKDWVF